LETLTLPASTVGPVARGHPWVYADGLGSRPSAGTPVRLVDGRGRTVAFGLADDGDIAVTSSRVTPKRSTNSSSGESEMRRSCGNGWFLKAPTRTAW
jgi:hypothetical protein